jgi:hypothetical protein
MLLLTLPVDGTMNITNEIGGNVGVAGFNQFNHFQVLLVVEHLDLFDPFSLCPKTEQSLPENIQLIEQQRVV